MVEKKPVSVNWQTLFILIPIIDLWAAYRIEKLGRYVLFIIAMIIVGFIVGFVEGILFLGMSDFFSWIVFVAGLVISIILIRSWSEEWNRKFEKDSGHDKDDSPEGVTYKYDNDDPPEGVTYKKD